MDKGKKVVSWILVVFLSIVLGVVLVFMIDAIKNVKLEQKLLRSEVKSLNEQVGVLSNKLAKANEEVESVQPKKTDDLNQEKAEIIRDLLLEKMPTVIFKDDAAKEKYQVINKFINLIEIYTEPYYVSLSVNSDNIEQAKIFYDDLMQTTGDKSVEAVGGVGFTTQFDKEVDRNDVIFAGNNNTARLYKEYISQNYIFTLYKNANGEYSIEIGTGF